MNSLGMNPMNPLDVSEFAQNIVKYFANEFLEDLQDACIKMYTSIFSQANEATESAALQLKVTPEAMFPDAYAVIVNISETVFFPIAGIILMFILSYESVSMLVENNRMKEFGVQDVCILIFKILGGVWLLTHSIDLVNAAFKIGQWAVIKAGVEATNASIGAGMDAISYIESCTDILSMMGYLFVGCIVKIGVAIFSVVVKVAVWLRFVELYLFVVSAPIPFSTFLNKEWGQMGFNYIRKILSLAFQPVYMIVCFSIFSGILVLQSGSDLAGSLMKAFAAMVILAIALFKTGTIADSIFNAH